MYSLTKIVHGQRGAVNRFFLGYFSFKETAEAIGIKETKGGGTFEIEEIEVFESVHDYDVAKTAQARAAVLQKLTPSERKLLGFE
jgi:hypothetical protein